MNRGKIIIAGGSGFIGQALAERLQADGYEPVILSRTPDDYGGPGRCVGWDGKTVGAWAREVDGAAAVVNLAGRNVNCRYTAANRREMDESRVDSVNAIAEAMARCARPPVAWVQASTTAIYGDTGDRLCDESCPPGEGYPVRTATQWEAAFGRARVPGTRKVILRIGFALGRKGGVLKMLARMARWFIGGAVGTGRQYITWIHEADLVEAFCWAITREDMTGVYNLCNTSPLTNAQFMRELRRAVHRPWSPRVPAWAAHIGAWMMRTEAPLALTGRRCTPARLLAMGFRFEHSDISRALCDLLR